MTSPRRHPTIVVVVVVALASIAAGVSALASTDIGAAWGNALRGIGSQIGRTGPAALVMLVAASVNLFIGALAIRAVRGAPFSSLAGAVTGGAAGAVLVDLVALGALGSVGLISRPLLIAIALVGGTVGLFVLRPIVVRSDEHEADDGPKALGALWWLLIAVVWAIPVVVQLASPVVAIQDVLPNHVAPVEYVRAYGTFPHLDIVPAPNYGPSRQLVGYVAVLGMLTKATGLNGALAASAFVLPLTLSLGTASAVFARRLFGRAGIWVLLTMPLTFSFTRLPDARGSVLAAPLLFLALSPDEKLSPARREAVTAIALGAMVYVHPLLGAMGIVLCAGIGLWRRTGVGVAGAVGGIVLAVPQVLTLASTSLPTWTVLLAVPASLGAIAVARTLEDGLIRGGRWIVVATGALAIVRLGTLATPASTFVADTVRKYPLLTTGFVVCVVLVASRHSRTPLLIGIIVSFAAAVSVALIPTGTAFWDGIRAEISGKTLQYWAPLFLAVGTAGALGELWERAPGGWPSRLLVAGLVALMVLPIDTAPTDALENEERRIAEQASISLDRAERGAWVNWPDSRLVVDRRSRELQATIAGWQRAGCLSPGGRVLRVSAGYQSWESTPVAAFTGAIETSVSLNADRSPHALGGRLRDFSALPRLLRSAPDLVLLEPAGLEPRIRRSIVGAGYRRVYSNSRGELFAPAHTACPLGS